MEASPFRPRPHPRIINNALATHLATKDLKQKQAFQGSSSSLPTHGCTPERASWWDYQQEPGDKTHKSETQTAGNSFPHTFAAVFFLIIVTVDGRRQEEAHTLDGAYADTSMRESRAFFLWIFPDLTSFRIPFPNFLNSCRKFQAGKVLRGCFFFFFLYCLIDAV